MLLLFSKIFPVRMEVPISIPDERRPHMKRIYFLTAALTAAVLLPAFPAWAAEEITFWTIEIEPERMSVQKRLTTRFTEATGVAVEIVPVEESQLPTRVIAAAAADALPDLMFLPLDHIASWAEEGILDAAAATAVIERLGPETFTAAPLKLASGKDGYAAIPVDGWGQMLLYRKDLFAEKAPETLLGIPDTWEKILAAAKALHDPPRRWGIAIGTDPGQIYTQQVFEHFALSNGARLTPQGGGPVSLVSPELIRTLLFYKELSRYSPPGDIYWRQAREDYFSGRVAMIVWSPFILDELAGLRDSAPVTAAGLSGRPLHEVTGFVTALQGPMGTGPAQWGMVNYFGICTGADEKAAKLAEFLLQEGYLEWLAMAPEGKFPLRPGFAAAWKDLKIGVDRKAAFSDLYPEEVIGRIVSGVENFDRWGFGSGRGVCIGQIYGTRELIRMLRSFLDGQWTAEETARRMTEAVQRLKGCS
jgi:multiple sugar transport system substrate-binding protein